MCGRQRRIFDEVYPSVVIYVLAQPPTRLLCKRRNSRCDRERASDSDEIQPNLEARPQCWQSSGRLGPILTGAHLGRISELQASPFDLSHKFTIGRRREGAIKNSRRNQNSHLFRGNSHAIRPRPERIFVEQSPDHCITTIDALTRPCTSSETELQSGNRIPSKDSPLNLLLTRPKLWLRITSNKPTRTLSNTFNFPVFFSASTQLIYDRMPNSS